MKDSFDPVKALTDAARARHVERWMNGDTAVHIERPEQDESGAWVCRLTFLGVHEMRGDTKEAAFKEALALLFLLSATEVKV